MKMKITGTNDSYQVLVQINVSGHRTLTDDEASDVLVAMGNGVIRTMENLPYAKNSVAGGEIVCHEE